jgi:Uma2 family endonuclease
MTALSQKQWTPDEYLAFDHDSVEKHEFVDGKVYMMSGASENHNLIVANLIISLGSQLRGRPCKLYPSDLQVQISSPRDYYYPDLSVVCGSSEIVHLKQDVLLNPTLIIEVLSPSTERFDRGRKFENYRTIPSLQTYLLVAQDRVHLEQYVRQQEGSWLLTEAKVLDTVLELMSIECQLLLSDVYDKVELE